MNLLQKLLTAFLSIMFFASVARQNAGPQTYAVVVGVSRYNDPNIIALKYAHMDAEAFRNFLESPKGGGVSTENVVLLTNQQATRSAILRSLRDAFNKATEEDVVIFFYSGHGVPDPKISTDLYFTTYDTDDENYTGSALLKDDVSRQFSACRAKLKLFFADACHSGGSGIYLGTKDDASELVNKLQTSIAAVKEPSWAAITASSSSEKSYEDTKWGGGHGVFTYQLLKGLEGSADKTSKQNENARGDGDGIVTVRELYDYLSNTIPYETGNKQHPDKQGKNEDIFPVSAVTPEKFVAAVKKYKKVNEGISQLNDTAVKVEGRPANSKAKNFDTEEQPLKPSVCLQGLYAYGSYCFINDYGEDLVLTRIEGVNGNLPRLNMMVGAGGKICVDKIHVSMIKEMISNASSKSIKAYFKTASGSNPVKYGSQILLVEACKAKTQILTQKNLYLSTDGGR